MKEDLDFKLFTKHHYHDYNKWFKNDHIKNALESIDDEWLDCVINDDSGIDYAIFLENEMVGVVGLTYPTLELKTMVINYIAINPKCFRNGIGTQILKALYILHPLKKDEKWVAYVEKGNHIAQQFFITNHWQMGHEKDDPMLLFEKSLTHGNKIDRKS